jgi:hypothetical protein
MLKRSQLRVCLGQSRIKLLDAAVLLCKKQPLSSKGGVQFRDPGSQGAKISPEAA